MVRTTLGAEVETTVTVSGSESVAFINADQTTALAGGSSEEIFVRPPTGFIYELLGIRLRASNPGGSSTDSHVYQLESEKENIGALSGRSSGDKPLIYQFGHWDLADKGSKPNAPGDQTAAVSGIRADATNGFLVEYFNQTSVTQSTARRVRLWVRQIAVGDT